MIVSRVAARVDENDGSDSYFWHGGGEMDVRNDVDPKTKLRTKPGSVKFSKCSTVFSLDPVMSVAGAAW